MEDAENKNLDDTKNKYLNEINDIADDKEGGETKDIKNKVVIQRDITENETETNQDTFTMVIEQLPDDQDDEAI